MNDDEWDTWVSATLSHIQPFEKPIEIETADERKHRIDQIDTDMNSIKTQRDIDNEDREYKNKSPEEQARKKQLKARKDELARYGSVKSLEQFKINFYNAIADQVQVAEDSVDTYSRFNRQYEEDPALLVKGQRNEELPIDEIPSVDVYLDCSSSFSQSDIDMERELVASIKPFVDKGEVILNIYYFANHLHNSYQAARIEGGNGAMGEIIKQINSKPVTKNVVFVSDSDERWYVDFGKMADGIARIEGCVWWIWKRNSASALMKALHGAQGNYQYMFS